VPDQPASVEYVIGGAGLLGEGEIEISQRTQRPGRFGGGPAPVSVEVQFDCRAERAPQCPACFDVLLDRSSPHLHLEGGDSVAVEHPLGLGDHLGGGGESDHVGDADPVGEPAQQFGHGDAQRLTDHIPDRHVDGRFGGRVADGAIHPGVDQFPLQRRQAKQLRGKDTVDDRDDRLLGFAVGERPRRRLGCPDYTGVGVHAHEHMLGDSNLAAGESQRFAVSDGERNRLHLADFHVISR
jgi:hypothetical protein